MSLMNLRPNLFRPLSCEEPGFPVVVGLRYFASPGDPGHWPMRLNTFWLCEDVADMGTLCLQLNAWLPDLPEDRAYMTISLVSWSFAHHRNRGHDPEYAILHLVVPENIRSCVELLKRQPLLCGLLVVLSTKEELQSSKHAIAYARDPSQSQTASDTQSQKNGHASIGEDILMGEPVDDVLPWKIEALRLRQELYGGRRPMKFENFNMDPALPPADDQPASLESGGYNNYPCPPLETAAFQPRPSSAQPTTFPPEIQDALLDMFNAETNAFRAFEQAQGQRDFVTASPWSFPLNSDVPEGQQNEPSPEAQATMDFYDNPEVDFDDSTYVTGLATLHPDELEPDGRYFFPDIGSSEKGKGRARASPEVKEESPLE